MPSSLHAAPATAEVEFDPAWPRVGMEYRGLMTGIRVRPFGGPRVWAPTGTEAAAFDRSAIEGLGVPQVTLMECAGRSAAQVLDRLYPRGDVVALVGAGNNGGDALVLLRTLRSWGRPVKAVLVADREADDPLLHGWDVTHVSDDWDGKGDVTSEDGGMLGSVLAAAAVVVDGILGTGIQGAPRARQARAIRALNAAGRPVFALDAPSGVNADTGGVEGEAVVADVTVAFGWPKIGTLLQPARANVGRLIAVEIGFPPVADGAFGAAVVTPAWASERKPVRELDTHKNRVGALLIVAGRSGMAGAAVMAGRAALRAGVGLLRVASAAANREIIQASVPEAVFIPDDDPKALRNAAMASHAVAVGPGLGDAAEGGALLEVVREASTGRPTVLDADALNMAASGIGPAVRHWSHERAALVTPHLGEMRSLTGLQAEAIAADRVAAARDLASETGATVLLKGLPSIVVPPRGTCWVDSVGSSDLATGGMGDVLTGVAGALLAQGFAPDVAGALALYMTGRAATRVRKGAGLTPSDVIEALPAAWDDEGPGESDLGLPFVLFDQDAAR